MGGNNSLPGGLHVQVQKLDFFPGQQLNGQVFIQMNQPAPQCSLYVTFKGQQTTRWVTGSGKNRRTHRGHHTICDFSTVLHTFQNQINIGGYSMPFCLILPQGIPASFHYQWGSARGNIQYTIEAKLISTENKRALGTTNIFVKQYLPNESFQQNIFQETNSLMSTWCCIKQGSCILKSYVPQNYFQISDQPVIRVEIDNTNSDLDARILEASLVRVVVLRNSRGSTSQTIHVVKAQSQGPPRQSQNMFADLQLFFNQNVIDKYTTRGTLITCEYFIRVRSDMDGSCMCCGQKPNISTPVVIFAPPMLAPVLPPAPVNWAPQELQPMNSLYGSPANPPPEV